LPASLGTIEGPIGALGPTNLAGAQTPLIEGGRRTPQSGRCWSLPLRWCGTRLKFARRGQARSPCQLSQRASRNLRHRPLAARSPNPPLCPNPPTCAGPRTSRGNARRYPAHRRCGCKLEQDRVATAGRSPLLSGKNGPQPPRASNIEQCGHASHQRARHPSTVGRPAPPRNLFGPPMCRVTRLPWAAPRIS